MEAYLKDFPHVKHFNLKEIKSITNDFDNSKVIGRGGFGKVYGGVLSHSKGRGMVAFKRLDRIYGQGDPEFLKEIFMLSRCTHENLISLLGFCDHDGEKILVYEHASHGSLDHHLSSTTLMWSQRVKICLGAARGLCYLHDPKDTQQRVIHRDIKSSNILLDDNWNAKVSDMGLSRIGPANQPHSFLPTNVVGTPGYIDPQYMETYSLTKESDVYSFGVVLFEVLCGKTCFKYYNPREFDIFVPKWKQSYEEKKLDEIIFHELKPQMDLSSLKTFSDVAYQCVQKSRARRPEMSQVVKELEIALWFQEDFEVVEQPIDYEELSKTAVPPLVYTSKEALKMLLFKGILVNEGKTWFSLNKKGGHCEMISAAECIIPYNMESDDYTYHKSRKFAEVYNKPSTKKFKAHVKTQFLSPHIPYTMNLVFQFDSTYRGYLDLEYTLAGQTRLWSSYLADEREDGWLTAELYHFTSHSRKFELQFTVRWMDVQVWDFQTGTTTKRISENLRLTCSDDEPDEGLIVEGIEFKPI